ncbi:calmodulin-binding protein 60 D-like [Apium graveolens]|uniref:calmodulin-binding protein 60 D-like n=1 Tax=Apium graveolens TaxID=4045 RepID=UPI003D79B8A6
MEGKTSVLQGTTTLKLKEGINSIDNLSFTQNSGTTIEPGKTESFDLKDHRVTSYAKKEVPSLDDKVLQLKHVGKEKKKCLETGGIKTILKVGPKKWEEITDHAKTCIINGKVHVYISPDSKQMCGVVFDAIGQLKGSLKESQNSSQYITWDSPLFDMWEQASQ